MLVRINASIHSIETLNAIEMGNLTAYLQTAFPGSIPSVNVQDNVLEFSIEGADHAHLLFTLEQLIVNLAYSFSPELWLSVAIQPAG